MNFEVKCFNYDYNDCNSGVGIRVIIFKILKHKF